MPNKPIQFARVRFKDCDPFGHLYNTRFIEYMLEAREDLLMNHYHFNLMDYAQNTHQAWVITKHEISYLREAKRNEIIALDSSLIYFDDKKLKVEYQIWNEKMDHLKSLLWTEFMHVSLVSKKSTPHSEELMDMLKNMYEPIPMLQQSDRIQELLNSSS